MIKLIALALAAILLLSVPAFASPVDEIDLSVLSWEELMELKKEIILEQWKRDEWQEVDVPQGVWIVGEDIPAGKWTVRCKAGFSCYFQVGEKLSDNGHGVSWSGVHDLVYIYKDSTDEGRMTEYTFDAVDGYYIVIDSAPATFTPFSGKPDLGFKK